MIDKIVLISSVIFIILYVLAQVNAPDLINYIGNKKEYINWVDIDHIVDNANNGDLVFLSGNTKGEKTCKYCTDSIYSHVGIVFREVDNETGEDVLYIWDSDLGQKTKDGARVMKLSDKLERYKGDRYIVWKKLIGVRPTTDQLLDIISKYSDKDFDDKILTWWVSDFNLAHSLIKNNDTVFCSELVAMTLQDLDILDKSKKPSWFSPGSFAKYKIDCINRGYNYGPRFYSKF